MTKTQVRQEELLANMIKILEQHKEELLIHKIKVIVAMKRCDKCSDDESIGRIQHASNWLGKFINTLREYRVALAYHTKEEWAMLGNFDGDQTEEMILKESIKKLKNVWKKRPSFFKNPVKKKKETK